MNVAPFALKREEIPRGLRSPGKACFLPQENRNGENDAKNDRQLCVDTERNRAACGMGRYPYPQRRQMPSGRL